MSREKFRFSTNHHIDSSLFQFFCCHFWGHYFYVSQTVQFYTNNEIENQCFLSMDDDVKSVHIYS